MIGGKLKESWILNCRYKVLSNLNLQRELWAIVDSSSPSILLCSLSKPDSNSRLNDDSIRELAGPTSFRATSTHILTKPPTWPAGHFPRTVAATTSKQKPQETGATLSEALSLNLRQTDASNLFLLWKSEWRAWVAPVVAPSLLTNTSPG